MCIHIPTSHTVGKNKTFECERKGGCTTAFDNTIFYVVAKSSRVEIHLKSKKTVPNFQVLLLRTSRTRNSDTQDFPPDELHLST